MVGFVNARVLRIARIAVASAGALIVVAVIAFVSPAGRSLVAAQLLGALDGKAAQVSGAWPGTLVLDQVVLADKSGPWLTLARATIVWRPLALLRGRLAVTSIRLEAPVLLRQPASSEGAGGASGSLPLAIEMEAVSVENGVLRGAGGAIAFAAKGAVKLDRRHKLANLMLTRAGGADEHLRVAALLDEEAHRIALDLDARAQAGGLFALLLGMPDLPAFVVQAHGAGPASDWRFEGLAQALDYGALALKGSLAWTKGLSLMASGTLSPGHALPPAIRTLIGHAATLNVDYTRDPRGAMGGFLALKAENLALSVQGGLEAGSLFAGRPLSGTIRLRTSAPIALEDGRLEGAAIDGKVSGTVSRPQLAASLGVESATMSGYSLKGLKGDVSAALASEFGGRGFSLQGKGSIADASTQGSTFMESAGWTLTATGDLNRAELGAGAFHIASDNLLLDAKAHYAGASGAMALDATLEAKSLTPLAPILTFGLDGVGTFGLSLSRPASAAPFAAHLHGRLDNGVLDGTDLTPLAGQTLLLDASLSAASDGALALKDIVLTGDHLTVKGQGALSPALDARLTLDGGLEGLAAFANLSAAGNAHARIDAKGTLGRPRLAVALESPEATVSGRNIGRLKLALAPAADAPVPNGRLTLQSRGALGGMDLVVPIVHGAGAWTIGPFSGNAFGGQIAGTLKRRGGDTTGGLKAAFGDLSGLYSLAGNTPQPMEGRLSLALDLGAGRDLSIKANGRGARAKGGRIALDRLAIAGARKADQVALSADLNDLRVPGVGAGATLDARRVRLSAKGPQNALGLHLAAEQITGAQGALTVDATLAGAGDSRTLTLSTFAGTLWREAVSLEGPGTLTMGPSKTQLTPVALRIGSGRLALGYDAGTSRRKADLVVSALPLAFVGRVLNADWPQGRVEGHAGYEIAGTKASGFADASLAGAVFSRANAETSQPVEGRLKGRWDGRVLSIESSSDGTNAPLRLDAKLPLVYRANAIAMDENGPVSGKIHWNGRLGALWALLPYDLHRLDGEAQVDGTASGRYGAPKLAGTLAVRNGLYESIATGTRLRNLGIDAKAEGGAVTLSLSGEDGRGGALRGSGSLQPGANGAVDANVEFRDLRVLGLDNATAEVSGPARLTGTAKAARLEGKLKLDHMDAAIPDKLPPSIPVLPVKVVGDVAQTVPDIAAPPKAKEQALGLALQLDIPGQAFLRGRGLTSEWRGSLSVQGTTAEPRVNGFVELVKGDIAFGGRSYALTRGRANFDGGPKVDPLLDIATERSVSGSTVSLTLTGPASAPLLDITSSPSLPRDQAMALFLFGKPAQSLTTLELIDVARSVATLSGSGGVFDPLERVRRGLGLDVLTVDVSGDTGKTGGTSSIASSTTLQAGRYISRKVYLGVKQGASTSSSALQLDYALTPHLSVGTEVGVSSGEAATVDYKWDY